MTKFLRFIM